MGCKAVLPCCLSGQKLDTVSARDDLPFAPHLQSSGIAHKWPTCDKAEAT